MSTLVDVPKLLVKDGLTIVSAAAASLFVVNTPPEDWSNELQKMNSHQTFTSPSGNLKELFVGVERFLSMSILGMSKLLKNYNFLRIFWISTESPLLKIVVKFPNSIVRGSNR